MNQDQPSYSKRPEAAELAADDRLTRRLLALAQKLRGIAAQPEPQMVPAKEKERQDAKRERAE